jgi:bifunctional DNA-binding transcriptional regulator/antitoxin component of YhaV-PrlF toxin-antitoxin module
MLTSKRLGGHGAPCLFEYTDNLLLLRVSRGKRGIIICKLKEISACCEFISVGRKHNPQNTKESIKMNVIPESTINLILSGLMGLLGGLITIPINVFFAFWLKKFEIEHGHKLDEIAKKRELLLQHKLELQRMEFSKKFDKSSG